MFRFLFLFIGSLPCFPQTIVIQSIESKRAQHTIYYSLSNEGKNTDISLFLSTDGGLTWKGPLEDAVRDVGTEVKEGINKIIIWNADSGNTVTKFLFRVSGKTSESFLVPNIIGDTLIEPEFTFVEQPPIFPLGDFEKYCKQNVKYPELALKKRIEGKVFVTFQINREGRIRNPQLLKGIGYGCNEEALRLISEMPKWIPGKNGGKAVKVRMSIPVVFKL